MFWTCSRICSIEHLQLERAVEIGWLTALEASVFASRLSSWQRKSRRLPAGAALRRATRSHFGDVRAEARRAPRRRRCARRRARPRCGCARRRRGRSASSGARRASPGRPRTPAARAASTSSTLPPHRGDALADDGRELRALARARRDQLVERAPAQVGGDPAQRVLVGRRLGEHAGPVQHVGDAQRRRLRKRLAAPRARAARRRAQRAPDRAAARAARRPAR